MKIIGAGMAGLLAAHMLRRHRPHLQEAQASLPNNHHALLRFRTDAVSRATGIPFKRVLVSKSIVDRNGQIRASATVRESNQYAFKVTGELLPRSILSLEPGERFVAPSNFIYQLADGLDITFDATFSKADLTDPGAEPIISTLPMPRLMEMTDWPLAWAPLFHWRPIWTIRGMILKPKADLYQTLYYPDGSIPWYRVSITGHEVIAESMFETSLQDMDVIDMLDRMVTRDFGLPLTTTINWTRETRQEYGKLAPTDDHKRRAFILAMTDRYRIYSLGRFATWRQILLDDVVNDIHVIEKFINDRDAYGRNLAALR